MPCKPRLLSLLCKHESVAERGQTHTGQTEHACVWQSLLPQLAMFKTPHAEALAVPAGCQEASSADQQDDLFSLQSTSAAHADRHKHVQASMSSSAGQKTLACPRGLPRSQHPSAHQRTSDARGSYAPSAQQATSGGPQTQSPASLFSPPCWCFPHHPGLWTGRRCCGT